eukprot:5583737-Pleurochrysis_carterae.AAC.1
MPEALNAPAAAGGAPILRVDQWVRKRHTGCFLCINAIYKPLLGTPRHATGCIPHLNHTSTKG